MQSVFVESISFLCGENPSFTGQKAGSKMVQVKGVMLLLAA